ncbi:MAG: PqqD family protein [Actinomycetota bacterium]
MSPTPEDRVIRLRAEGLEWREVDGEVVILDLRSSRYMAVNRTGRHLWEAVSQGATRTQLVARLRAAFDIDEATARDDVDGFVETLGSNGLLASQDEAASPGQG